MWSSRLSRVSRSKTFHFIFNRKTDKQIKQQLTTTTVTVAVAVTSKRYSCIHHRHNKQYKYKYTNLNETLTSRVLHSLILSDPPYILYSKKKRQASSLSLVSYFSPSYICSLLAIIIIAATDREKTLYSCQR